MKLLFVLLELGVAELNYLIPSASSLCCLNQEVNGREEERDIITSNLLASRLTLLYGASGVGKSSVLHAGVAGRIRGFGEAFRARLSGTHGDHPAAALHDLEITIRKRSHLHHSRPRASWTSFRGNSMSGEQVSRPAIRDRARRPVCARGESARVANGALRFESDGNPIREDRGQGNGRNDAARARPNA